MASTSETGHVKNVANFETLLSICKGYGTDYNPSKDSLKITQLEALHQEATAKLNSWQAAKIVLDNATNERRTLFADFKPFATQVVSAFSVSGASPLTIDDAKSINKKIQGTNSKRRSTASVPTDEATTPRSISTSQQSYDRLIDHFSQLIALLKAHPVYAPNERALQITALENKLAEFKKSNSVTIDSYTSYTKALQSRDTTLYNALTGLVQTSKEVKQYVKSIYTASSREYKQISALEFKTVRK